MGTLTITPTAMKRIRLEAHYDLIEEVIGDRYDHPFVPGVGNVNARLCMVGEAPGRRETEKGEPFVGPSGRMLNKGLKSIGLRRKDVFITNFLHYQPDSNNRDPKGDEIPICLALLRKELAILAPRIVVTLGRFATSVFFENPHMGTLAGQAWIKRGHVIVPMFHPASVMYGGYDEEDWYLHFQTVADCLNQRIPTATTPMNGTPVRKSLRGFK